MNEAAENGIVSLLHETNVWECMRVLFAAPHLLQLSLTYSVLVFYLLYF